MPCRCDRVARRTILSRQERLTLPEGLPAWVYVLMSLLTVAVPLIGALAFRMKKASEKSLLEVQARMDAQQAKSQREMEQVKTESAQALAASRSIEALTNTLVTMVEERRESTSATKENTAELKNVSTRLGDWDERQRLFFQTFSANITAFNLDVAASIKSLQEATTTSITAMIPKLVENVKPMLERLDTVVAEVQRTSDVASEGRDNAVKTITDEVRATGHMLLSEVKSIERMIERLINDCEKGKPDETLQLDVTVRAAPEPAADGDASAGTGTLFELHPSLI